VTLITKSGDQSKTTDAALADDSELSMALAAGTPYHIEATIENRGGTTANLKWAFKYSGTLTTAVGMALSRDANSTLTAGSETGNTYRVNPTTLTTPYVKTDTGSATTTFRSGVYFKAIIQTNTSGTFSFQWAQATSSGNASVVYAGSSLEIIDLTSEL
jgi:hypothetical protein